MPPEVLLRVLASIDGDAWPQGETKRRILGHVGAHPEGVAVSREDLAELTYRSRGTVHTACTALVEERVLLRAGGVGSGASWYMVNPAIEEWEVPWAEKNPAAAELVRLRAFHVEHRSRDNGAYVRLVARPMARATTPSSRAAHGPRDGLRSRAGYGPRDKPPATPPRRAGHGPRDKNPVVARAMARATTEPIPSGVVLSSVVDDETPPNCGSQEAGGGPDPVFDALVKALTAQVVRHHPGRTFPPTGRPLEALRELAQAYGADRLHELVPQIPPEHKIPRAVTWLRYAAAPTVDAPDDVAPAFGVGDGMHVLEAELLSLQAKAQHWPAAGIDADDEGMRDLVSRIESCENELAAITDTGGPT